MASVAESSPETAHLNPRGERSRFCTSKVVSACHVVVGFLSLSLLAACAVQFNGTWGDECDYMRKVWVLVALARLAVQMTVLVLVSRVSRSPYPPKALPLAFFFLHVSDFFSLCWFLYGIKPVLVLSCPAPVPWRWAVAIWSMQCIVILVPCLLLCVCMPLLCIFIPRVPMETQEQPTPEAVINKLRVEKYMNCKDLLSRNSPQQVAVAEPSEVVDVPALSHAAAGIRSFTGLPLPDPRKQIRRMQSAVNAPPVTDHRSHDSGVSMFGKSNNNSQLPTCPICVCEFEDEDMIVLMPCDERHAFHQPCLKSWLLRSRACPVCRQDVVEALGGTEATQEGKKPDMA